MNTDEYEEDLLSEGKHKEPLLLRFHNFPTTEGEREKLEQGAAELEKTYYSSLWSVTFFIKNKEVVDIH